jgi:hypothetical protein
MPGVSAPMVRSLVVPTARLEVALIYGGVSGYADAGCFSASARFPSTPSWVRITVPDG